MFGKPVVVRTLVVGRLYPAHGSELMYMVPCPEPAVVTSVQAPSPPLTKQNGGPPPPGGGLHFAPRMHLQADPRVLVDGDEDVFVGSGITPGACVASAHGGSGVFLTT